MGVELKQRQKQAVDNRGGKLLVSAAAGSGKTKVLVERLLSYITDPTDPANVDDFLIVTFTKAAAAELRGKIAAGISERIAAEPNNQHLHQQMQRLYLAKISTVHGFCGDILRENAYQLDIPGDFRVAEQAETDQLREEAVWEVLGNAYESAWKDADIQSFLDGNEFSRNDENLALILHQVYDSAVCHLDPDRWLDDCVDRCCVENVQDASKTMWGDYLLQDLRKNLGMYADAMEACLQRMEADPDLAKPAGVISGEIQQYRSLISLETWDEIVSKYDIAYDTLRFPAKVNGTEFVEQIKAVRNAAKDYLQKKAKKNFLSLSADILADLDSTVPVTRGLVKLVKQYRKTYDRMKRSYRVLDFGDLEHKTLDLLWGKRREGITTVAREVSARFREVMVDEYQDTNAVQDGIFRALTEQMQNCFMVGDVKQSIYQFRLADPGIFLDRYMRYTPADSAECGAGRKIILNENFRSSRGVIDAVNDVFSVSMSRDVGGIEYSGDEILREGIEHQPIGEREVELYAIDADEDAHMEEANFVANRIKELLNGKHMIRDKSNLRPIRPEDITILLRSTKASAAAYEYALSALGIPCASSNNGDILSTEEISDLLCLLQVISNPRQDVPLIATLINRVYRFSADNLAQLRIDQRDGNLYEAIKCSNDEKAVAFVKQLTDFRQKSRVFSVSKLLNHILTTTHFDSIYSALDNGNVKKENIQDFLEYTYAFCANGHKTLDQFLHHLEIVQSIRREQGSGSGGVSIGTIHSSKGLEYPVVFLCDLSHDMRFEDNKSQVLCHKQMGIGFNCLDTINRVHYPSIVKRAIIKRLEEETLNEEMRILYVAMTRAKDRLIMTYSVKNLERDLKQTVLRMPFTDPVLLCKSARCLGDWIMFSALQKTEAGEIFAVAGNPGLGKATGEPWLIRTVLKRQNLDNSDLQIVTDTHDAVDLDLICNHLYFQYPHSSTTAIPSKLTATQIKGRMIDHEVAEDAPQMSNSHRYWKMPLQNKELVTATGYGTAIHAIMEHIDFAKCGSVQGITEQVDLICSKGLVTQEEAKRVDVDGILHFFNSEAGKQAIEGYPVFREFKFSVLVDAREYYECGEDEQVLLQGVVDFAVITDDGIVLVDFKTDHVTQENLGLLTATYAPQVKTYAKVLERIFEKKVISSQLYFFRMRKFVSI